MPNPVCCEKCIEEIGKISPNAARLWMDLCSTQASNINFIKIYRDFPELRTLENMGYLVSTEKRTEICVKLLGLHTGFLSYFCTKATHA